MLYSESFGILRNLFRNRSEYFGIFQNVSESFGISRNLSEPFGFFRNLSGSFGIFQNLSESFGPFGPSTFLSIAQQSYLSSMGRQRRNEQHVQSCLFQTFLIVRGIYWLIECNVSFVWFLFQNNFLQFRFRHFASYEVSLSLTKDSFHQFIHHFAFAREVLQVI